MTSSAGVTGGGTAIGIQALPLANSSPMENAMCWEMDYQFFAEQKKAHENKIKENQTKEEQRDKVIAKLLDEAKVQGERAQSEKTEEAPIKEVTPAK
jgi:hypothetical protein